jgi:phosphopantetheinyl transferase
MEQRFFLFYDHIENYPIRDLEIFADAYCKSIRDDTRKKESLLARKLLDDACRLHLGLDIFSAGFKKDEAGKPMLTNLPDWHISISHADGHVWAALSEAPFGIDFERICPENSDDLEVAFHADDWNQIFKDPLCVYHYFCLKEAYVKLLGCGFLKEPAEIRLQNMKNQQLSRIISNRFSDYWLVILFSGIVPENLESTFYSLKLYDFETRRQLS